MKTKLTVILLLVGIFCLEAQEWSWTGIDPLAFPRMGLSAAVLDDTIFYSGGRTDDYNSFTNIIEIYDIGNDEWSLDGLSSNARFQTTGVTANGMVFFAGGINSDADNFVSFADVDIYNKETGEWTVEYLSNPKLHMGVTALGKKVYFGGGLNFSQSNSAEIYNKVDIYNSGTGIWSVDYFTEPRWGIAALTAGGKVFFAGGVTQQGQATDVVDVYDTLTNDWSVITLSEPRAFISAVAYGDRVYFAGGTQVNLNTRTVIDVYNVAEEAWEETLNLSTPRIVNSLVVMDALVFAGSNDWIDITIGSWGPPNGVIEIFYPEKGEWDLSTPDLIPARFWYGYASYENKAYFAGGWNIDEVLGIINVLKYTPDPNPGVSEDSYWNEEVNIYPNPFNNNIQMDFNLKQSSEVKIFIYDSYGRQVGEVKEKYLPQGNQHIKFKSEKLESGIYFCVLKTHDGIQTKKVIKL